MTDRIPDHLAHYNEDEWLPHVRGGIFSDAVPELRRLRARELWRRAQDAWAHEHGLDRAAFERLRDAQVGRRRPDIPMVRIKDQR